MRLWTWRPGWDPLSELQRHVGRLFDLTLDTSRQLFESWKQYPALNLYETASEFIVLVPLPGARAEDIDITVTGNTLTLRGERQRGGNGKAENYRREERFYGKWSRSIQAPEKADLDRIEASLENGILLIKIAKLPELQPRQVPVKAG